MIKNFNVKRGDQFSFTITFANLTVNPTTMNFGVKKDYESPLIISKSLNNGINTLYFFDLYTLLRIVKIKKTAEIICRCFFVYEL